MDRRGHGSPDKINQSTSDTAAEQHGRIFRQVQVYQADSIDVNPTRPKHVLMVVEVVCPGPQTTDRIVRADQYAKAGIPFY